MKKHLGFLLPVLITSVSFAQRKTVGDLLGQVRQESRGANLGTNDSKSQTALPTSKVGFEQRAPVDLSSVKPPKSNTILKNESGNQTAEYERILDQQIKELFKLTQRFKNSPNRGELWLRLAELYVEKSTLVDQRKQDEYDQRIKLYEEKKLKTKPVLDTAEAKAYNKRSIQLYEWFLKDFPSDSRVAQAYFFLGFNYFELGDPKRGAVYYDRLTKEYPNSPFILEAHFALAEYYFENERWADAYKEYSPLIKAKKHRLNSFALYKGAWCLYRLGKYDQALKYLEFIIKSSAESGNESVTKKVVNRSRLETESLRDIVVFYAAQGDPNKAADYFRSLIGKGDIASYLEKLAYYYSDKGNREAAKDVFEVLIQNAPTAPKAFEYQYQIVQNYFYSKNSPRFKEELYKWVKNYDKDGAWAKANEKSPDLIANSYKLRETTLRNWTLQQHQTAQNSHAAFSQGQAMEGYRLYLAEFPDSAQSGDMHFYYGELLYDLKKYDEASDQYKWVVENAPKSQFYTKAAQNLLLGAEKTLPTDAELQKKVGSSTDPVTLPPAVEKYISAAQWYISKFPNSPNRAETEFRIGRLFYQTNHFSDAEKWFKQVATNHPKTKYAEYSANLLLDIYNLRKDYIGLEKTGTELLAIPGFAESKTGSEIKDVLEKANFKKAQELEIQKNYGESAKQFEAFATQNPKSELANTALFNAGVNYERAANPAAAIVVYNRVLGASGPEAEKNKPKVRRLLAKLYQEAGLFDQSADLYKKAAIEAPNDPLAPNYIYNAALMYEATGKNTQAIQQYNEFIKKNKKHKENVDAMFSIAELYRKNGQKGMAIATYKQFLEEGPGNSIKTVEANYWIMDLSSASKSMEWREKVVAAQRHLSPDKKGPGAKYAARVKLIEAKEALARYKAIRIPANPAKQKKVVDEKIQSLAELTKSLNDVIKYDSAEEIVSALTLLGDANQNMVEAIQNTPLPAGLNDAEKKQYQDALKKIWGPFQQKARDGYKLALDRAGELDVYNSDYVRARNYMSQVDPGIYNNAQITFEGSFVDWMRK